MKKSAVMDPKRMYRLALRRRWCDGATCCFIMLNPSTADEDLDDPTIRRCINFARSWGYSGLMVLNIFALRATDPKELSRAYNPVGIFNDSAIFEHTRAESCDLIVAAWGAHRVKGHWNRGEQVVGLIGRPLYCLGKTKAGHPRHPLYVSADTQPILYREAV